MVKDWNFCWKDIVEGVVYLYADQLDYRTVFAGIELPDAIDSIDLSIKLNWLS
jgi:hypothetical protein